jgi:hypothetical protein
VSEPDSPVEVGDVWWLPEALAGYPGGKDRFCLIVALENPNSSADRGRAHYVAGSTKPCGKPVIVFEPGEANLNKRGYFGFYWSGDISIAVLTKVGRLKGHLAPERKGEIRACICASKRIALKRLGGC